MQIREVVVTGKEQVVLHAGELDDKPGTGELLLCLSTDSPRLRSVVWRSSTSIASEVIV